MRPVFHGDSVPSVRLQGKRGRFRFWMSDLRLHASPRNRCGHRASGRPAAPGEKKAKNGPCSRHGRAGHSSVGPTGSRGITGSPALGLQDHGDRAAGPACRPDRGPAADLGQPRTASPGGRGNAPASTTPAAATGCDNRPPRRPATTPAAATGCDDRLQRLPASCSEASWPGSARRRFNAGFPDRVLPGGSRSPEG